MRISDGSSDVCSSDLRTSGANWVVTDGLKAGERVITQGIGNLRQGAAIRPVPASSPQRVGKSKDSGAEAKSRQRRLSRLFINRLIFAWVLALIVMLCRVGSLCSMPIQHNTDITPTPATTRPET